MPGSEDRTLDADAVDRAAVHDRQAPWWAAALVLPGAIGVSTTVVDLGDFWRGYVLDVTGPAWTYILFRGRFTTYVDNAWTRFLAPTRTVVLFVAVAFAIEGARYLHLHVATFDAWDLLAYVSVLVPLYLVDVWSQSR